MAESAKACVNQMVQEKSVLGFNRTFSVLDRNARPVEGRCLTALPLLKYR